MSESSSHSFQVADVLIVSVDARGFSLAAKLAKRGWKVVVIELTGGLSNQDLTWSDRLGPFLAWDQLDQLDQWDQAVKTREPVETYPALWLNTGLIELGGPKKKLGLDYLRFLTEAPSLSDGLSKASPFSQWPRAITRSVVSSRMLRAEDYLNSDDWVSLPLDTPIGSVVKAEEIAESLRQNAIRAGARLIDAERIVGLPSRNRHLDRIEFELASMGSTGKGHAGRGNEAIRKTERTRSVVWMLSREESSSEDYVYLTPSALTSADSDQEAFKIDDIAPESGLERSMGWWRMRFLVGGLETASSAVLRASPELPTLALIVSSVERPWTHGNLIAIERVESTTGSQGGSVYDAWIRIPYWARMDHVYRDEQRLLVEGVLKEKLVGCTFRWVTPSPIALTDPAVRLPFIVYSEPLGFSLGNARAKPNQAGIKAPIQNLIFSGPETWRGLGSWGLKESEPQWLDLLEGMRREWDLAARKAKTPARIDKEVQT